MTLTWQTNETSADLYHGSLWVGRMYMAQGIPGMWVGLVMGRDGRVAERVSMRDEDVVREWVEEGARERRGAA